MVCSKYYFNKFITIFQKQPVCANTIEYLFFLFKGSAVLRLYSNQTFFIQSRAGCDKEPEQKWLLSLIILLNGL